MHVPQLLYALPSGAYVEVIEAFLPEFPTPLLGLVQSASEPHLQDLHYCGWVTDPRFGYEQVEVLGHHDVPDYFEAINRSNFFEDVEEQVATCRSGKKTLTVVTTAGDEMEIMISVDSVKTLSHSGMVEDGLTSICDYRTMRV